MPKIITPAMRAHLYAETTRLAAIWRITRKDGAQFFFTDQDRDIVFGGEVYRADAGFERTAIRSDAGFAVDNLDLVVNVDPPSDHKDYLHRGGRTARAGESGSVVTLVLPNQRRDMTRLMADAGITPQVAQVRSGEAELSRITGAQAPSGVPVTISSPVTERGKGNGSRPRGRRGARPGQGRRSNAGTPTPEARAAAAQRRTNKVA